MVTLIRTMVEIDPAHEDAFNTWYRTHHYPALKACPGVLSVRRYASNDNPRQYLSIIELSSPEAAETPQYIKARTSPFAPHFTKRARDIWTEITPTP